MKRVKLLNVTIYVFVCRKKGGILWRTSSDITISIHDFAAEGIRGIFWCFLLSLLMLQRRPLWDMESMLTKQTGWCYLMNSHEHIECATRLIYIGLALRQRRLFIKMTTVCLLYLDLELDGWEFAPQHHITIIATTQHRDV